MSGVQVQASNILRSVDFRILPFSGLASASRSVSAAARLREVLPRVRSPREPRAQLLRRRLEVALEGARLGREDLELRQRLADEGRLARGGEARGGVKITHKVPDR